MVNFEKYLIFRVENPLNLGSQQFYKIFKFIQSILVVSKTIKGNIFYLNNYID